MHKHQILGELVQEWGDESRNIMNWWSERMVDELYGGFLGFIYPDGSVKDDADKGIILNTRILWGFSFAARFFKNPAYIMAAERAYHYLKDHFLDTSAGGLYWMLDYQGNLKNGKKQIYAQAFGIYAFSEYYLLTQDSEAKEIASGLFDLIETHSLDLQFGGYMEAFDQNWGELEDLRLGIHDENEPKTMNTHLHILEAYTNLYRIEKTPRVGHALENLLKLFINKFLDQKSAHLHLFFDTDWTLKSNIVSYGHDIEASWLMWEAAEVLGKEKWLAKLKPLVQKMANVSLQEGLASDGPMINEYIPTGGVDTDRIWWVQAEAMVGFMNAFQIGGNSIFLDKLAEIWRYTQKELIDHTDGEWFWGKTEKGDLMPDREKAGPWKAPYHSIRALVECIARAEQINGTS